VVAGAVTELSGQLSLLQFQRTSPLDSKTAAAAGAVFRRMRYGGIATPGRSYQVCLLAFVPARVLLWQPEAEQVSAGTISDLSPCRRVERLECSIL
jgi:hypothetical protein